MIIPIKTRFESAKIHNIILNYVMIRKNIGDLDDFRKKWFIKRL